MAKPSTPQQANQQINKFTTTKNSKTLHFAKWLCAEGSF